MKDEQKNLSDIIADYFDKNFINKDIIDSNINKNRYNIVQNLSCVIIEFFF